MKRAAAILAIVAGAAAASYFAAGPVLDGLLGAGESREDAGARAAPTVDVAAAREANVAETVSAVGTARALRSVEIRPDGNGRIVEVAFSTGDEMEAEALLVRLDDRAEQAALKRAEARLAEVEGDLSRARELEERDIASAASLEAARAAYLVAEAAVEEARNALADRRVVAPFDGTVGLDDLDIGQWVVAGEQLTTLDDLSAVEIAFSLPEPYFAAVRPGRAVEARAPAYPDRTFSGAVTEVGTRIDPSTRAFPVRARIPNGDRALAGGLFMDVSVALDERRSVVVPEVAVIREGERTTLFVVEDATARRVDVTVGRQLGGDVEILEGVSPGQDVIVGGLQRVGDGDQVTARRTQTAEPA